MTVCEQETNFNVAVLLSDLECGKAILIDTCGESVLSKEVKRSVRGVGNKRVGDVEKV